ncbi:universal stress protein [Streptomyces sp. WAC05374]|uniref:universal stress protein n=1 Tax=Streptomyces sp. WAC05374 TaxID=2487420 RepID=UPI000F888F16|nr:universal stress protein [Streptomyces sp. WAC05374]RST17660.1 universal stress protein [Streptomyces sp. WAC05374]TDF54765.1 universal stress protein [Streptomyces sp. WAC05374]TDF56401.1 universal stress protein [Streptomyces sp. WAC05374]
MRKTITVGMDGSAESNAAAAWAAREATLRGLPLTLLQAGYEPTPRTHLPEIDVPAEREDRALDFIGRRLLADCPGLVLVPRRSAEAPVPALVAAAESSTLLALGSQGFSSLEGFMVGSVALDVTARARGPVVLVRAGERARDERAHASPGTGSAQAPFRRVVLGLDLEHPGEELLSFAFEAAKVRATSLTAVYAWRPPALRPHGRAGDSASPAEADTARNATRLSLAAALRPWREKYPEVAVMERLADERPAPCLRLAAEDASLLVVGHRADAGTRLGPVTHAMIHHAACPLAVVPHSP